MKRRILFVALAACAIALLAMVGVAGADGGPHGGYTPTTDGCAGCHRAHTAPAPSLLTAPIADLCYSCHGASATGADTNVENGIYLERDPVTESPAEGIAGRGLKGGGFASVLMNTSLSGSGAPLPTTSAHTHDASVLGTAWGNGAIGSGPGLVDFALQCTNCHDPHGNGNYRILRGIPSGSLATVAVNVPDDLAGTKNYTIDPSGTFRLADQYWGQGYGTGCSTNVTQNPTLKTVCEFGDPASNARSTSGRLNAAYTSLSAWCSACHTRYSAPTGAGVTDSGDAIFAYRHTSSAVAGGCTRCHLASPYTSDNVIAPLGSPFDNGQFRHDVQCMTCHVAHGTSADMTTDGPFSGTVAWPDGTTAPNGDERSSLLRIDGRGVCQGCHYKSPAP